MKQLITLFLLLGLCSCSLVEGKTQNGPEIVNAEDLLGDRVALFDRVYREPLVNLLDKRDALEGDLDKLVEAARKGSAEPEDLERGARTSSLLAALYPQIDAAAGAYLEQNAQLTDVATRQKAAIASMRLQQELANTEGRINRRAGFFGWFAGLLSGGDPEFDRRDALARQEAARADVLEAEAARVRADARRR